MTDIADRGYPAETVPTSRRADDRYDLNDRFRPGSAAVLLTGVQAIARQLVEQHVRDLRSGNRSATFVSGYQGSPLSGVDRMLAAMPGVLAEHDITFVPGLNEELAATAVWGSQGPMTTTHDGVVGVWYGKGPGVDRATDALRHANMFGVHPTGGMVLYVGDDPAAKSSTVPAVSERSLAALGIPVLFPRNAREIVGMGLHAVALSRASGCIVALKIVADVADGAWPVDSAAAEVDIVVPDLIWAGKPYRYRQRSMQAPADSLAAEADLYGPRWAMVAEYGRRNRLDVVELEPALPRIGLAAAGPTYDALRQALLDLGVTESQLGAAGVRLLRIGMPFPLVPASIREFAAGLDRVIVVEDKTAFIEAQIREILYDVADAPRVLGKRDAVGRPLFPADGELTAGRLLDPLFRVLHDDLPVRRPLPPPLRLDVLSARRGAFFCSGCPHNRSTVVPEGSAAAGGIGCHIMVTLSDRAASAVTGVTQMGGEGAQWIGQAPFTDTGHLFQNIGDGTFFHSGQLAIQACVAAGVNITYKLLYNDVVAMTGAQDPAGALGPAVLSHTLLRQGVRKVVICADEPDRYRPRELAAGTLLLHRDRLDEAQRMLREIPGVTVLIYDQHCAADARRKRKRGELPARRTRVVINEAVCEGCGDCGTKSNCLSVQPVQTEFGRKTRIEQNSCNTDYSCLDGDCPAFATVELTDPPTAPTRSAPEPPTVAEPAGPADLSATVNVLLAGIGGTGIVTVNQVLATAALRAGYDVASLDQTGLSQKAGPVVSHLRFGPAPVQPANRLTPGSADCLLAFDLLTATDERYLGFAGSDRTVAIASTGRTPTGAMVADPARAYPADAVLLDRLTAAARAVHSFDALAAAQELFGSTTAANFLLVGAAYQVGALGIPAPAIEAAIALNGVAVPANIAAFRWGRAAIAAPTEFAAATTPARPARARTAVPVDLFAELSCTGETRRLAELRAAELVGFQSARVAREYLTVVERVWRAERAAGARTEFSAAVARGLYKFTAYKDEYEVARRLVDPAFADEVAAQVPGGTGLTYRLHPPVLRALGRRRKIGFGPRSHVALRVLAKGKTLRGTRLDPFGYAHLRRVERALLSHYRALVVGLSDELTADYDRAVQIAELADLVRGYEGVKLGNVERYRERLQKLGVTPPAM
ncbi:indolepyruvate ferredoxin oxidoreductase family protein [Skermania piniformis]|uniref:Indolepyruvate ferredoxin oxidoreductase family protein n=1 Tax=Skermania pinensis TaxID=39122 RepID=A0ABX8S786_9ACTN|nr:indolepyruvate ferredoxin oxidoreductase family protein [Skermania piniformis]QXQ13713.1 indolepyruvate ferredoxin oxidoreductase family protein [Skermania piniformis]